MVIPAGQDAATIDVVPIDAGLPGPNQPVTLTLSAAGDNSYTLGPQASDTVTLLEDDPPQVGVQATQPTADELAGTPGVFTVTRNGPTDAPLVVDYLVSGTAANFNLTGGVGQPPTSGSVTIPAGQSSATINVTPFDANLAGPNQAVTAHALASQRRQLRHRAVGER